MSEYSAAPNPASRFVIKPRVKFNQLITWLLLVCSGLLIAWQWRSWRTFDWNTFAAETRGIHWNFVALAVVLSLVTFPLRAWRWQIFLRPMRQASFRDVLSPTLIGFTGFAILGRPGELVRPYMIARRTGLTMSSQMGVWMVERIFDMAAFAVLAAIDCLVAGSIPDLGQFRTAAWITLITIVGMAVAAILLCRW